MLTSLWIATVVAATPFDERFGTFGAELSGYRLTQPRYGASRTGEAVMIWVTEPFSKSKTVKLDHPNKTPADAVTVLKLNLVKKFPTGVYDYSLMTSVFSPLTGDPRPLKVSFSSQEWCGNLAHQLTRTAAGYDSTLLSYFEAEGDRREPIALPKDAVLADELFFRVRELVAPFPNGARPLVPSLEAVRLSHVPLRLGTVTSTRAEAPETIAVPAGKFQTTRFELQLVWGPDGSQKQQRTVWVEKARPHRIIAWEADAAGFSGNEPGRERGELTGSIRNEYWKHQRIEDEALRRTLGLTH